MPCAELSAVKFKFVLLKLSCYESDPVVYSFAKVHEQLQAVSELLRHGFYLENRQEMSIYLIPHKNIPSILYIFFIVEENSKIKKAG